MSRPSALEPHDEGIRKLYRAGATYEEIRSWLALQGCHVVVATVWRYLNKPNRGPRVSRRQRQIERWRKLRRSGLSYSTIARMDDVTRQAVHEALKRADAKETLRP